MSIALVTAVFLSNVPEALMHEAFEHGGKWTGLVTVFGFAIAFSLSTW